MAIEQVKLEAAMKSNVQMGFHYFNDTKHYTKANLTKWHGSVGEKTQWMCLKSSCSTAIPEVVLQFCDEKGIRPIIQFDLVDWHNASTHDFVSLLKYYKMHGIEYIQIDGEFNQRKTWDGINIENTLLSSITGVVLEFQKVSEEFGFYHVLPNLVPGGDYWDLVVLKSILQKLHEAHMNIDSVVLSFNALINSHPLLWGKGGKKKWCEPQPYQKEFSGEDHQGFMGFEWYQEVAFEEFGKQLPILLLETGKDIIERNEADLLPKLTELIEYIADLKHAASFEKVAGICFAYSETVFTDDVAALLVEMLPATELLAQEKILTQREEAFVAKIKTKTKVEKIISHYLLLPKYDWGISPWHLEVALPFIRKYKPTIGYSVLEAAHASFVTIVMDNDVFSQHQIETLRNKGCKVVMVQGDGTEIANKLAAEQLV